MKKLPGEGKVGSVISGLTDLFFAGILWFICSLPVITLGSASTALYYSVVKCVRHDRGRLAGSFFSAFKSNFPLSTKLWLLFLVYGLVSMSYVFLSGHAEGSFPGFFRPLAILMLIPALLMLPWIFAYISRFDNSLSATVKYALYLSIRNLARTMLLILTVALTVLLCWLMPALIPVMPGMCCLIMSFIIEPVFRELARSSEDSNEDRWYNE